MCAVVSALRTGVRLPLENPLYLGVGAAFLFAAQVVTTLLNLVSFVG